MHLAYSRWQNLAGEESAPINCGHMERDGALEQDMVNVHPHSRKWWDLVMSLPVSERCKAEFFKLYHLLPPPDIDPLALHYEVISKTSNENNYSPGFLDKFINFCKAYDFCRYVSKRRRLPRYKVAEGYQVLDSSWYKRCKTGRHTMPPEDEWGKVWIHGEFPYDPTGDFHVMDAKDCTRVVADLRKYMDRSQSRCLSRVDQNELLSAIFNGSTLSNGETMHEWRSRVMAGRLTDDDDVIAAEAGKAENTKPGEKTRETLSACDTVREFLTEVDHSIRPLAALTPGVSIRVDQVKHKKKFQAMAHGVSKTSTGNAFATSTDLTAWSPHMPRRVFHSWQKYALTTTECPNPESPIALWDRLVLFCDRRGVKRSDHLRGGNVQGWPATSDTTMHAHILIMWAYELRTRRILSRKEAAHVLCLIDDAATEVVLEGDIDSCEKKAKEAKELLQQMYSSLGFEMDSVKSFFSSIKFVYLNELYIDGAQVMHSTKTLMRTGPDYTRRFASLLDNIATVFGIAASAASQGADPFVSYFLAGMHSFYWVFKLCPDLSEVDQLSLTAIAMAPRTLNGLGIRPITSVMATGESDHLTWYIEIMCALASLVSSQTLTSTVNDILGQEMKLRSATAVFSDPSGLSAATHRNASRAIHEKFREAARSHGLAEPFSTLDTVESDPKTEELLTAVLQSGAHEAALLEEVSASMPTAFIDEVMARVDRTELVAYLLGSAGIMSLRRLVYASDQSNLLVALSCCRSAQLSEIDYVSKYSEHGSFAVASSIRDENLLKSGFQILNHTRPCPFSLLSFRGQVDMQYSQGLTTVTYDQRRLRSTVGSSCLNMYDSVPTRPGYRGYRTLKSSVANEIRAVIYNPVRKKVARGLAALRWARSNGAHSRNLTDLFLYSWSGHVDDRLLTLRGKEVEGSPKRLSLRYSKINHAVMPFQNCQSCVVVNAMAASRHHAQSSATGSTMYDMMAVVTLIRCAGLLEAALGTRCGKGSFEYGFAYKDHPVPLVLKSQGEETPLGVDAMRFLTPMTELPGDIGRSAKVVCSYSSMSKTIIEYTESGAQAAARVFESAKDEASIEPEDLNEIEEHAVAVRAMSLAERYSASAHIWENVGRRPPPQTAGAAAPVDALRAVITRVAEDSPLLEPRAAARKVSESWRDMMALNLVERNSKFANALARVSNRHGVDWATEVENWEVLSQELQPRKHEFLALVHDLAKFCPDKPPQHMFELFLRSSGIMGYHFSPESSSEPEDMWHQANSFFGTTLYITSASYSIGSRLRDLKPPTSSAYSSVSVSSGRGNIATVTRVLKAQWRLAAERRTSTADRLARLDATDSSITRLNYLAVFYRLASRILTTTGKFSESAWNEEVVQQTIESVSNHIEKASDRESFVSDISKTDLEDVPQQCTCMEVAQRVVQVATIGQSYADGTNPVDIASALSEVWGHVKEDLRGNHLSVPYKRSHITTSATAEHVLKPKGTQQEEKQAPSLDLSALDAFAMGGMQIGDEEEVNIDEECPSNVVHWALMDEERRRLIGFDGSNVHMEYATVTSSSNTYSEWLERIKGLVDTESYERPEFSIFAPPSWDDEGEGDVVQ